MKRVLKFLHTDPKHQRRGAGSALIQWGLEKSRELQLPAFLEASVTGYKLYAKHGFRDIATLDFNLADWGGEGTTGIVLMLRPYDV
jgi:predicted N-acetyltransferase YhbS